MSTTELDEQTVAQIVRAHLRDRHPGGVSLDVIDSAIRKIDHWWHVPIRTSEQPSNTFEYYDALAEVESEIQEAKHLNILLVSALGDDPPAKPEPAERAPQPTGRESAFARPPRGRHRPLS